MKQRVRFFSLTLALFVFSLASFEGLAQGNKGSWPDSLTTVNLEGTVIIDTTYPNVYFLDVDGDTIPDYHLSFGPDWYTPESGAVRPAEGDYITILGAINSRPLTPVVIVFEINGLIWREPIENWWNHQGWCDSLEVITVSGTVMVDTTYFYLHYYLDTNDDGEPDYFLSFGPHWYEPESGATRPTAGEIVTIEGAVKADSDLVRLVVLKINDLLWRDQFGPAPWSGGWIGKKSQHHKRIHCPTDSSSWVEFPPGAMQGGGHHGHEFADSIYCEFAKVWCDSLPGRPDSAYAGWHFHFSNPDGKRMNGKGESAKFMKRLRLQLHCGDGDSCGTFLAKFSSFEPELKYLDENTGQWLDVENAVYDELNQVITFEPESVETYYAIFSAEDTSTDLIVYTNNTNPEAFNLEQNYPNSFNPTTTIGFQINAASLVKLSIYNMLGQEVRTLINELKPVGVYQVVWDGCDNGSNLGPTGNYSYKLKTAKQTQVRGIILVK